MAVEPLLSVILPAHNEAENIPKMARRLAEVLTAAHIRYEVLFVNDGSTDNSWDVIRQTAQAYPQVRGIRFSRAFGKEAALYAGLQAARGDCCVTLDCDLQHPVETIPEMYRLWTQGIEVVEGVKRERGTESAAHRTATRWFYGLISKAAKTDLRNSSDFKLLDRKAVLVLLNLPERNTFYRALSAWVGFRTARVEFDVQPRTAGQSSWSTFSLIRYAISSLASFTSAPLYLVILMGFLMLIATLLVGGEALFRYLAGKALEGFTTVILLQLFTGTLLMFSLGIIGGFLADKFGRKFIFTYNLLVYMLGVVIVMLAMNFPMLLAGFLITGISVGIGVPASWTYISESSEVNNRGRNICISQMSWAVGPMIILLMGMFFAPGG